MNTCLAIFSCHKGNGALIRHWPYFQRQKADTNFVITTENTYCEVPEGATELKIGVDDYINGSHLPSRMVETMSQLMDFSWDTLVLAEYDTLILNRIQVENMGTDVAAHLAGHYNHPFYHNPWVFEREAAIKFIEKGRSQIEKGICSEGCREASPDVFFGTICYEADLSVESTLWKEFSRNSYDRYGDIQLARAAYLNGVDIIHGIKTIKDLEYVTNEDAG